MKKKTIAIIMITTLLLSLFSTAAVFAADDHGADAHSDSMANMEDQEYDGEDLSLVDTVVDAVMTYLPYIIGAVCGVVVLVIIIKIIRRIRRGRKPKYTGRH